MKPILSVTELEVFSHCEKKFELAYLKSITPILPVGARSPRPNFTGGAIPLTEDAAPPLQARERGELIHEILQYYDPARGNLATVVEQALFNQHFTDPKGEILNSAKQFVTALQRDDFLNRTLFQNNKSHQELEFALTVGDFILSGQIDKLVQNETLQGSEWMIVDYKTHRIKNAMDRERLAQEFEFQMLCYALAVKKNFNQDSVSALILFTDDVSQKEFRFDAQRLQNFEVELQTLYHRIQGSVSHKNFEFTKDSAHCEKCAYFKEDYCGVKLTSIPPQT